MFKKSDGATIAVIVIILAVVVFVSYWLESKSQAATSIPSIPNSGEYADDTSLGNVSLILDYRLVNGAYLADLTEVYSYCDVHLFSPAVPGVAHITATATMEYDGGGFTIQASFNPSMNYIGNRAPLKGTFTFTGNYDSTNDTFTFTSSDITTTDSTGPTTLTFTKYDQDTALSSLDLERSENGIKSAVC